MAEVIKINGMWFVAIDGKPMWRCDNHAEAVADCIEYNRKESDV